jgi:hypothetical protein
MLGCMAMARGRLWGFDDEQRRALIEATGAVPELRAVIARAKPHAEIAGLWLVRATVNELDEMYSLVGALMDTTRGRRRLEMLEGMLASLCTSIDGF